jgi:hypothetical protein
VKQRLVAPVFEQIHQYARSTWSPQPAAAADPPAAGDAAAGDAAACGGEVPIVLLSIGASADHAFTCPDLVHFLRQKVGGGGGVAACLGWTIESGCWPCQLPEVRTE